MESLRDAIMTSGYTEMHENSRIDVRPNDHNPGLGEIHISFCGVVSLYFSRERVQELIGKLSAILVDLEEADTEIPAEVAL